jgi:hypothetical protein
MWYYVFQNIGTFMPHQINQVHTVRSKYSFKGMGHTEAVLFELRVGGTPAIKLIKLTKSISLDHATCDLLGRRVQSSKRAFAVLKLVW